MDHDIVYIKLMMYLISIFVQYDVLVFTSAFPSPGSTCLTLSGLRLKLVLWCVLINMYSKILSTLHYFALRCNFQDCSTDVIRGIVVFVIYSFMCVFQTLTATGSADW